MEIAIFNSSRYNLRALALSTDSSNLPADYAPWQSRGTVSRDQLGEVVITSLLRDGFFLTSGFGKGVLGS